MNNVLVIGSVNIDIIAAPYNKIVLYDKNPGRAKFSYGGVGRNICENLSRLGCKPTFLTIVGDDDFGLSAVNYLKQLNTKVVYKKSLLPTNTFISFLDNNRDNYLSVSSMDMIDEFDYTLIGLVDIESYDLVVCDANSKNIISCLANYNCNLFVDATSIARTLNLKDYIKSIKYLKCTQEEFEVLFNNRSIEEVIKSYSKLNLIITNKDKEVVYNDGCFVYTSKVCKVNVVNAVGAGDSFSSGIVYGLLNNYDIHKCINIALKTSSQNVQSEDTVDKKLSRELIGE